MSAYIVGENVIQYLVNAGKQFNIWFEGKTLENYTPDELKALGQMLWDENTKSVCFRYRAKFAKERQLFTNSLVFKEEITRAQVVKTAHNLDYQSCEHKTWEKSRAFKFLRQLVWEAAHTGTDWDNSVWGAPPAFKNT